MTNSKISASLPRALAIFTAAAVLIAATDGAFAKNNGNSNHSGMSNNSSGMKMSRDKDHGDKHSDKHKDKDKDKYAEKKKKKGCEKIIVPTAECGVSSKDPVGNTHPTAGTGKDKAPVVVNGGFVLDKLPNGTSYYRRATKDEMEASKGTGTTTAGNNPPAAPAGDTGPVVRDHRPGGNADDSATVVRDHRTDATGKTNGGPASVTITTNDLKTAGKVAGAIAVAPTAIAVAGAATPVVVGAAVTAAPIVGAVVIGKAAYDKAKDAYNYVASWF